MLQSKLHFIEQPQDALKIIPDMAKDPLIEKIFKQDRFNNYSFPNGIVFSDINGKVCENPLILNEFERIKKIYGATKNIRVFIGNNLPEEEDAAGGSFENDIVILHPNTFPESTTTLSLWQRHVIAHEAAHLHYNHPAIGFSHSLKKKYRTVLDWLIHPLEPSLMTKLIESFAEMKAFKSVQCSHCLEQFTTQCNFLDLNVDRKDRGYYTNSMIKEIADEFRKSNQTCPDHTILHNIINLKAYERKILNFRTTGALAITGLSLPKPEVLKELKRKFQPTLASPEVLKGLKRKFQPTLASIKEEPISLT